MMARLLDVDGREFEANLLSWSSASEVWTM